ncbi:amino acid synthesis family protein [Nocardioides humi]|uniref:Amino acid synthesis family protein n=1 Tax=Nocardioides humi TaxID=449461 RepID=A0ABN2AGH1_9ACTN|nr:amino acid synthesis family protein [Nocardioides humi]
MSLELRRIVSHVEELRLVLGRSDEDGPLRKVAVCGIYANPFAGAGYVENLSPIVAASAEVGSELGRRAAALLEAPVQSYGKAGLVGTAGEQEHVNAAVTSVFGDAFREAVGGGRAWITSTTKMAGPGATIDVPLAFKDEIWVRSHYDAVEVSIPAGPAPDELVVIVAVSNRGRINARVGGMTLGEAQS